MRLVFIFLQVIIFYSCAQKQVSGCDKFITGNYYFLLGKERTRINIERGKNYQTEYNQLTDTITGYNIKWTSKCEYEVFKTYKTKKTTTDSSQMRAILEFRNVVTMKFRIIETSNDYYVFESWKDGSPFVYKDTLWVSR